MVPTFSEIGGGLYAFPLNFGLNYTFINAGLPQPIIERFGRHDAITLNELMDIYTELNENYGDYSHLEFSGGASYIGVDPRNALHFQISSYIDLDSSRANLVDNRLIGYLENYYSIFENWDRRQRVYEWVDADVNKLEGLSSKIVFWMTGMSFEPGFAFLDVQSHFLHGIPLVDDRGRYVLNSTDSWDVCTWGDICITTGDNEQLAWEFTKFLIGGFSRFDQRLEETINRRVEGQESLSPPIQRDLFAPHAALAFEHFIDRLPSVIKSEFFQSQNMIDSEIERAVAKLAGFNDASMTLASPFVPRDLYEDDLDLFMRGAITAEEFVQQAQNAVTLWLMGG